jgi:hypothetical protein
MRPARCTTTLEIASHTCDGTPAESTLPVNRVLATWDTSAAAHTATANAGVATALLTVFVLFFSGELE